VRVTPQVLHGVLAHDDPHVVVLGLGEQTVRVDELAVSPFQGFPLVHVAVHQHGAIVVMCVDTA
jgi:hypothetical protein